MFQDSPQHNRETIRSNRRIAGIRGEEEMNTEELLPEGEKIRKAVKWFSQMIKEHPDKPRKELLLEAEIKFDLSPKECEFLNKKFL